jgi:hypothetical protein
MMKNLTMCVALCATFVLAGCRTPPVTIVFPDFPQGLITIDLGQRITIEAVTQNDGGQGVTWSCAGAACLPFTSTTPTSVTFKAIGITGTAKITATSKKQPSITKSINILVGLNEMPDLLCGRKQKQPGAAS